MTKKIKKQPIIIHTTAWMYYVNLYNKYCKPSIMPDVKRLEKEGYKIIWNETDFDRKKMPVYTNTGNLSADIILGHLRKMISKAIKLNAIVFMAAPDIIYGKNSMYNAVKLAEGKPKTCIAFPHLRIIDNDFKNKTPTNREVVQMVFDNPHQAFTSAFDDNDDNGTYQGGLSIRKIDDKNYCMIVNLPTVHVAQFNQQDQVFWDNNTCMGNWDRGWLYQIFLTDRLKVIGSSDIAFGAEITSEFKNTCPLYANSLNNDKFHNSMAHNVALNKFYCSLIKD